MFRQVSKNYQSVDMPPSLLIRESSHVSIQSRYKGWRRAGAGIDFQKAKQTSFLRVVLFAFGGLLCNNTVSCIFFLLPILVFSSVLCLLPFPFYFEGLYKILNLRFIFNNPKNFKDTWVPTRHSFGESLASPWHYQFCGSPRSKVHHWERRAVALEAHFLHINWGS